MLRSRVKVTSMSVGSSASFRSLADRLTELATLDTSLLSLTLLLRLDTLGLRLDTSDDSLTFLDLLLPLGLILECSDVTETSLAVSLSFLRRLEDLAGLARTSETSLLSLVFLVRLVLITSPSE